MQEKGRRVDEIKGDALVLFGVVLTGTLSLPLLVLLCVHTYLLLNNCSSIEFGLGQSKTFSRNSFRDNFEIVMGKMTSYSYLYVSDSFIYTLLIINFYHCEGTNRYLYFLPVRELTEET